MSAIQQKLEGEQVIRAHWRGFRKISKIWRLSREEKSILLELSPLHLIAYWHNKSEDIYLSSYQVERLSFILSIYHVGSNLMKDPEIYAKWVRTPLKNDQFNGKSPLDYMVSVDNKDLNKLCEYLMGLNSGMQAFE